MIPLFLFGVPISLGEILILDIAEMNNEILSMTDDQIYNNSRIRASMNLDVTGLKSGDALIYDKY